MIDLIAGATHRYSRTHTPHTLSLARTDDSVVDVSWLMSMYEETMKQQQQQKAAAAAAAAGIPPRAPKHQSMDAFPAPPSLTTGVYSRTSLVKSTSSASGLSMDAVSENVGEATTAHHHQQQQQQQQHVPPLAGHVAGGGTAGTVTGPLSTARSTAASVVTTATAATTIPPVPDVPVVPLTMEALRTHSQSTTNTGGKTAKQRMLDWLDEQILIDIQRVRENSASRRASVAASIVSRRPSCVVEVV